MTKNVIVGALVALVILLGIGYFSGKSEQSNLGSASELLTRTTKLIVGNNGTVATKHLFGTCNAATTQLPLEATSTDAFTCTVTGAATGDVVRVTLPSDSGSFLGGFTVSHAIASTNTLTFGIVNLTGSATSSFPLATTSVQYEIWDN